MFLNKSSDDLGGVTGTTGKSIGMADPPKLHKTIKGQAVLFAVLIGIRVLIAGVVLFPEKILFTIVVAICASIFMRYLCSNIWSTKGMIATQFMLSLICSDLVCFLVWLCVDKPQTGVMFLLWMTGAVALVFMSVLMLYGVINERIIVRHSLEISSAKLEREYRIAVLSDIHYATIQNKSILEKAVQRINDEQPDAIMILGDIAEEHTPGERIPELFDILARLKSEYGTFFVHGNHDRQEKLHNENRTYTDEEFNMLMKRAGITCIDDQQKELNSDLVIIGREDFSFGNRKTVEELFLNVPDNHFVIVMEHQPIDCEKIAEAGAELCLAGHYHGAQNWTNNIIYRLSDIPYDGYYRFGELVLYVNAGIAGSKYPIRTHSHNEYLMVHCKRSR